MATATSYNVVGVREDLSSLLTVVTPEETPVLSRLSKDKAPMQPYTEWLVDDLATPTFTGTVEGEDVTGFTNKSADRARIGKRVDLTDGAFSLAKLFPEARRDDGIDPGAYNTAVEIGSVTSSWRVIAGAD